MMKNTKFGTPPCSHSLSFPSPSLRRGPWLSLGSLTFQTKCIAQFVAVSACDILRQFGEKGVEIVDLQDSDSGKQSDLLKEGRCCNSADLIWNAPIRPVAPLQKPLPLARPLPPCRWQVAMRNRMKQSQTWVGKPAKLCKAHHIVSNRCNQVNNLTWSLAFKCQLSTVKFAGALSILPRSSKYFQVIHQHPKTPHYVDVENIGEQRKDLSHPITVTISL